MPGPASIEAFLELGLKSGLLEQPAIEEYRRRLPPSAPAPETPRQLADAMVRDGLLTAFQADTLMAGRWRGFLINGKYRLLQKVGSGGMGFVGLYEHIHLRRRVALKFLPLSQSRDPDAMARFYREARAVACLDHPNIVRCHDIDSEGNLHFIVLEYIDGSNFHDIIRHHGPMAIVRVAHYIRQAALGLQHAHEAGLVHRDIKPGNLLLDRNGVVKLLDMGLARFFGEEEENLSYDQEGGNALGTADYLAPEQVQDSRVDIRADIYGLGVTFYYLLSGKSPFAQGTVAQKLIWHQVRQPKPIRALRPEVPQELADILDKMMAKDPGERFQTPAEVAEALDPWTQTAIPPPPEAEMPSLDFGPRSSGTSSNNTPSARSVLSPLGIRSSPPTPISRAPRSSAPRTVLRVPEPGEVQKIQGSAPEEVVAAKTPAFSEAPPAAKAPAQSPVPLAPEVAQSQPAPAAAPEGKAPPETPATKAPAAVAKPPAPSSPPRAPVKPAPPAPLPVPAETAPETKSNLASKAPTKLTVPRKIAPSPAQGKKPASARSAPEANIQTTAKPADKPAADGQDSAYGNAWIIAGASILALGLIVLIWALM